VTRPVVVNAPLTGLITAVPAVVLAGMAGFELRWVWYLSAWTVVLQVIAVLLLLQREFKRRLGGGVLFGRVAPSPTS